MRKSIYINNNLYCSPVNDQAVQVAVSYITGFPTEMIVNRDIAFQLVEKGKASYKNKEITYY